MRALRPETALSWKEILCVLTAEPMRPSQLLPVTDSGTNHTYIGIIRANAGAVYQITVSAGGIDKSYAQSSIKLEAANNYIYNFTSTNKLILNSVNVTPFASDGSAESGGDLNAT